MGGGGIGGLFSDGSATSLPFMAQASGGPVTIPQGSEIANMAPGLTGFEPQSQPQNPNFAGAMKGLMQGLPDMSRFMQPGQQAQPPGMMPQTFMPQRYATGAGQGQAPKSPLADVPMVSMPMIQSALQALKSRMGSF